MGELTVRVRIRNFKSLRDFEIELKPGLNLIVGRSGSGKTNLIEAFRLLREVLKRRPVDNPFSHWWRYRNVVYSGNEGLPIVISLTIVDELPVPVSYSISMTGAEGSLRIIEESLSIKGLARIVRKGREIKLIVNLRDISRNISHIESVMLEYLGKSATREAKKERIVRNRLVLNGLPDELAFITIPISSRISSKISMLNELIGTSLSWIVGRYLSIVRYGGARIVENIHSYWRLGIDEETILSIVEYILPLTSGLIPRVKVFITDIKILRPVNMNNLRNSAELVGDADLEDDMTNLAAVLMVLQSRGGKSIERIGELVRHVFGENFSVFADLTEDGKTVIRAREGEIELNLPSLPDGLLKLLLIELALGTARSILLIDELESIFHLDALRELLEDIRSSKVISAVTAHPSSVANLVNLVNPGEIIVLKRSEKGTIAERIKKLGELRELAQLQT